MHAPELQNLTRARRPVRAQTLEDTMVLRFFVIKTKARKSKVELWIFFREPKIIVKLEIPEVGRISGKFHIG